jgi:capsular exopolysaccharide synthesis family protein
MKVPPNPSVSRRDAAIATVLANLTVTLPKDSRVVPISFESPDPKTAATVANSYAENFIAANLQRHFDTSTYSKNFLQKQLEITKGRLENSERSLLAYARAAGIVDTSQGAGAPDDPSEVGPHSLTTSNLVQLNQAYAAARSARLQAEQRWQQAQSTPLMSLPDVLTNPAIEQLTQKRAELEADYQQQLQHRKPDHPAVKQAAAALKELDTEIASIAGSIRSSIENQYQTSARQESALAGSVSQLKGATLSEQTRGIRYNILKREVDTNRQLYDALLQRFKEVSAEAGVTPNNISIVDLAEPPTLPVSPNAIMNLALAGVAGVAFAMLVVLGREMFNDSVRGPEDVERRFGIPILGAVPKLGRRASVPEAIADNRSKISEPYQAVRASIDLASHGGPPEALLVTSSKKGEGKSSTALAVARNSAGAGRKVLLIDADMRSPSLHSLMDVPLNPGLAQALANQLPIEHAIRPTDSANLDILPAGYPSESPAQLLSGNRFAALLKKAKQHYDQVIIDSPPVLGLADTLQMAAVTDRTVLVVGCDRADRRTVRESTRRLAAARANVLGAVLVKFAPDKFFEKAFYSYYYYDDSEQLARSASNENAGDYPSETEWPVAGNDSGSAVGADWDSAAATASLLPPEPETSPA